MPGAADRAINMALRVLGVGDIERDFKRVGDAGSKSFAQVEKAANGAALEVSEYTARLKRVATASKAAFANIPEANKGTAAQVAANRKDFVLGAVEGEKANILAGKAESTSNFLRIAGQTNAATASLTTTTAGLVGALGEVTIAFGVVAGAAYKALQAYQEHEQALAAFNAQLALTGNRSDASAAAIEAMAERIVASTGQTEAAALKGAQSLATVSGITSTAMQQALDASARFADAVGKDLPDVIDGTTRPVLQALADKDLKALFTATEGLNDHLRATILQLAETGRTAEAQQAFIRGLTEAAGEGPGGLTTATNDLNRSWTNLKIALGEDIAGPAGSNLTRLAGLLDWFTGKIKAARLSWLDMLSATNPATLAQGVGHIIAAMLPGGGNTKSSAVRIDLEAARQATTARDNAATAKTDADYLKKLQARLNAKPVRSRGGGRGRAAVTPREDHTAEQLARRDKQVQDQMAGLDSQILSAKQANLTDIGQITEIQRQQLAVEIAKRNADIDAQAQLYIQTKGLQGLSATEAARAHEKVAQLAAEKSQTLTTREIAARMSEQLASDLGVLDRQRDALGVQEGLAKTTAQRRDIQLRLLDIDEQEERLRLQRVVDLGKIGQASAKQVEDAQAQLAAIDANHGARVQAITQQNAGPLGRYLQDTDPAKTGERVEGLVADELTAVRDGINSAISNALGIQDPLLQGLLNIFLDDVLFRPIADALQKADSGLGGGGGLGGLLGSIGSLFGGGGAAINGVTGAGFASGLDSEIGGWASSVVLPGFAAGTPSVPTGLDFWVGENGRERMRAHPGGRLEVVNGPQAHRAAANDRGVTIIQNYAIAERADPRRTRSSVARGTQTAIGRAARKGLAS